MSDASDATFAEIRDKARAHALDWYLSALRAPEDARADLLTLAAFRGEITRIPLEITDAALAEIKLQWWRDAITQGVFGARSGNPIADALVELLSRRRLAHEIALRAIDGYARELYEDGIEDEAALEAYAAETEGALGALAVGILSAPQTPETVAFNAAAAEALALARLALTLPVQISRGRVPLPLTWRTELGDPRGAEADIATSRMRHLEQRLIERATAAMARVRVSNDAVSPNNFAAFLSVVLVEPYLRAVARKGHDALRHVADISPVTRVVRLLLASWRRRV